MIKIIGVALLLALSGCGGGGSGSTPPSAAAPAASIDPNLTVPLQAALSSFVVSGFNRPFTINGFVDTSSPAKPAPLTTLTGNGTLTIGAPVPSSLPKFPGVVTTSVASGSIAANGTSTPFSSSSQTYYNPADYTILGTVAGQQTITYAKYSYPTTVKAGSAGTLESGNDGGIIGTLFVTTTYSVAADTSSSLLVTEIQTRTNQAGTDQAQSVYRISTSGVVNIVSITATKSYLGTVYQSTTFTF